MNIRCLHLARHNGMRRLVASLGMALLIAFAAQAVHATDLDAKLIGAASGTTATATPDGVVRIGWSRSDVKVTVDGVPLPPAAGLGSWAAFSPMPDGRAMVMGDTVVFEDEVDAAMDAAFAHGLAVTALHNHFFYDTPKVYFMHIGGEGTPDALAHSVKAVWDAIRAVRSAHAQPATGFSGATTVPGTFSVKALSQIVGHAATDSGGVVKITIGRNGRMHDASIGAAMGLTTWIAFSGSDKRAAADGDVIMTTQEVQPTLKALRAAGFHVVALHNHMMGEIPGYFFTHFWGKGPAEELARGFRAVLDAQSQPDRTATH
jgi:hypothetical protein